MKYTIADIEQKLQALRGLWVTHPDKRWLYQRQANLLKISLSMKQKKLDTQQSLSL